MTKRKDQRRELLKEDEFLSILERIARYAQNEPRKMLIGVIGFVVVLALIFGGMAYIRGQRTASAATLYDAEKILAANLEDENSEFKFASEQDKYEAALEKLDEVISSTSGAAKHQAIAYKISCLVNLGRQDEVEGLYKTLANAPGFKTFGLMGLGDYHLARGQHQEALAQFERLSDSGLASVGELAYYKKAQCYKAMGENDKARDELNKILNRSEENAQSPMTAKARALMDELEGEAAQSSGNS